MVIIDIKFKRSSNKKLPVTTKFLVRSVFSKLINKTNFRMTSVGCNGFKSLPNDKIESPCRRQNKRSSDDEVCPRKEEKNAPFSPFPIMFYKGHMYFI